MDPLTFHQALLQAEAQARSTLDVALHERLSCAVALVKDGAVFQTTDGTWQVDSSSTAGLTYRVNGLCSCDDHHYNKPPQGLCKHRLAMFLSQRVLTLMRQPPAPVVPEMVEPWPDNDPEPAPEAPAPTPAPLPEAPASVNVRLTVGGREVQLTLRDTDEGRLLVRLQGVLAQYPLPIPAQASTQGQAEGWCAVHNVSMKSNEKNGRRWFSHRLESGEYCKGKGR